MPELPEVEVTRQGITPHIVGKNISKTIIRVPKLRFPIPEHLAITLQNKELKAINRRGKYLLFEFEHGTMLLHLGMSGHLRVLPNETPIQKHDHVDMIFDTKTLRYHDPRRFGAIVWHSNNEGDIFEHPLLRKLGVEPFSEKFTAEYLYQASKNKTIAIKQALLAGNLVVGVGNIYCSESLFRAKIHPLTPIGAITLNRYKLLVNEIRDTLAEAIEAGGSSLKDFVNTDGKKGYFQQNYYVYGRENLACQVCNTIIKKIIQGQRASFFCPKCQKLTNKVLR